MSPGRLPEEVSQAGPSGRPPRRDQDRLVITSPFGELEDALWKITLLVFLLRLSSPDRGRGRGERRQIFTTTSGSLHVLIPETFNAAERHLMSLMRLWGHRFLP